jgi:hypothetical protein
VIRLKGKLRHPDLPTEMVFNVALTEGHPDRGPASYDARTNTIHLWVLPEDAAFLARRDPEHLWAHLGNTMMQSTNILVHEVTHMLDQMRGGHLTKLRAPQKEPGADPKEFFKQYINNPVEYNAHFQEGVYSLVGWLRRQEDPALVARVLGSYEEFESLANQTEGISNIREFGNTKYRRKLDVRLWQTWQHLRDTW